MAGVAIKRCDVCHVVVMLADRGEVVSVGKLGPATVAASGDASIICGSGHLVTWAKAAPPRRSTPEDHPLYAASVLELQTCMRLGHNPLNAIPASVGSDKVVIAQNICQRCGTVYALGVAV